MSTDSGSPPDMPAAPNLFTDSAPARVMVNGLTVRTAPSTSAAQLVFFGARVALNEGDRVFVLGGPVAADGYWWAMVGLAMDPNPKVPIPVAWVAVGTASDPWLVGQRSCPTPNLTTLSALPGIERVDCSYGTVAIMAHQSAESPDDGLGGACPISAGLPGWLMCDNINYNWVNADGGTDWQFLLHFNPASGIPETGLAPVGTVGQAYYITGHFDDPAAADCVTATDPGSTDAVSQWLTCASKFVVDSLRQVD